MSTVPSRRRKDSIAAEPAVNIVNLSNHEFAVLSALRDTGHGRVEVLVRQGEIVKINRSQHLLADNRAVPRYVR